MIGERPETVATPHWTEDLESGRECFRRAGVHVDEALARGDIPVLAAADCSLCMATLPAARARRHDARILWLDAHGDFNTPDTTPSGFLGGMCLAGACGAWDPGVAEAVPAEAVVLAGVRDLDVGERTNLEATGATVLPPGETLAAEVEDALGDAPVYVHLDVDVLAGEFAPAAYPAPGGLTPDELERVLVAVAERGEVAGLEVTAFHTGDPRIAAKAVRALLPGS